jgi:alcohol dehydrogenase class IV
MIFSTLDLPPGLRDVGIPAAALPAIATTAMGDWFLRSNPRPVRDARELHEVLEAAW